MEPQKVARAFVLNAKNELLVLKRSATIVPPNMYHVPGGRVEADESIEEALVRELQEEVGIIPKTFKEFTDYKFDLVGKSWHSHGFLITEFTGEPKIMEPEKSTWMGWVPLEECLTLEPQAHEAFSEPIKILIEQTRNV